MQRPVLIQIEPAIHPRSRQHWVVVARPRRECSMALCGKRPPRGFGQFALDSFPSPRQRLIQPRPHSLGQSAAGYYVYWLAGHTGLDFDNRYGAQWTPRMLAAARACLANRSVWLMGNSVTRQLAFTLQRVLQGEQAMPRQSTPISTWREKLACGSGGMWRGQSAESRAPCRHLQSNSWVWHSAMRAHTPQTRKQPHASRRARVLEHSNF